MNTLADYLTEAQIIAACEALLAADTVPRAEDIIPLIRSFYELDGNGVGGKLHVVTDDLNVRDVHIDSCIKSAAEEGDEPARLLGMVLRRTNPLQRHVACDFNHIHDWEAFLADPAGVTARAEINSFMYMLMFMIEDEFNVIATDVETCDKFEAFVRENLPSLP